MLIDILFLILGLFLLVKGGDLFVDSSVGIARALRISPLIIGATIVSIATTSPELTVSAMAAWRGETGLAIGNAVGSCIANIGLIIGLVCLLRGAIVFKVREIIFSLRWMILMALIIFILTLPLKIYRVCGPILVIFAIIFLIVNMRKIRDRPPSFDNSSFKKGSLLKHAILFILGALLVVLGSRLLVSSAVSIAHFLGISPTIIGLTIASIGTSLPELVTALTSIKKNRTDLSLGNIIGANVLNLTLVIGTASSIHPLVLSRFTQVYSIPAMLLVSFVFAFFILVHKKLTRKEGKVIFTLYVLYIFGLLTATLAGIR